MLFLVVFGSVAAAGLAYLGTQNGWLSLLTGLAALLVMRVWWICERRGIAERAMIEIHNDVKQLSEAVSVLSLEIADLNIHSHFPSHSD